MRTWGGTVIAVTTGVVSAEFDVVEMFIRAAAEYPERSAVVHNGCPLSYGQLDALVRQVAQRLGGCRATVGVSATRSPGTIVGLLAVWTAGGTYCPVDPGFPAVRRQAMLAAAGCRTRADVHVDVSPPRSLRVDLTDVSESGEVGQGTGAGTGSGVVPQPAATSTTAVAPESVSGFEGTEPAYILFTSGSTGEPKPVVTPRRAIAITIGALRDLFGITADDRVLQFASLNWDTCFEEILPTLTAGATLVLDDEAHCGSFPRFLRMIERRRITVLNLPTAYWHELVHYLSDTGTRLSDAVRVMVIGGEAVNPARLADWCELDTAGIRLVNTYGCTETTLITHAVDLHGPFAPHFDTPWREVDRVPIGWPLPHVRQRISAGGELWIGGPALALGYRGLPEATRSRFVTADTTEATEATATTDTTETTDTAGAAGTAGTAATARGRYFRTGDRVVRRPDGMLVPAGRLDNEVKVRGIRVDPGEVEAHLASHPHIGAAAVVGVPVAGRTALVAYVVPHRSASPGSGDTNLDADLRDYLRGRVPGHLVPSRITVVAELVHTASGKVDRLRTHQRHAAPEPR